MKFMMKILKIIHFTIKYEAFWEKITLYNHLKVNNIRNNHLGH